MAFLHQLKLLLWKNGLAAIRQPLWSVTLIVWPLIIFIIIAVTRHQFPPIVKDQCYVGPRNLPSTGFFPFLQTLMCNTDSHCHNKSHLFDPTATRSSQHSTRRFSAKNVLNLDESLNFESILHQRVDAEALVDFLKHIVGSHEAGLNNISVINFRNTLDNETLHAALESASMIKKTLCTMALPRLNSTQSSVLTFIGVTYCTTNETMFEASLNTLNKVMVELLVTRPEEVATFAGMAVMAFDRLQNETSLWESLLAIPLLLRSRSVDQALDHLESLLTNILGTMNAIQNEFPEAEVPLPEATSLFDPVLSLIHYAQNWKGRDVYISLGDIVRLENDSLSEMMRQILFNVEIPLDKAIALTLDKETVHMYICNDSSTPLWLSPACSFGTVRMLLEWIDPDLVAKQILLAWSKYVAQHDMAFVSILVGQSPPGEQEGNHIERRRRSVETQPQNIDEELFLWFGGLVLDVLQIFPEADTIVHNMLSSVVRSMKIATLTFETLEEITEGFLNDADHLKQKFQTLASDPSEASVWISEVLDSGVEAIMMAVTSENATCEDVFSPFRWLLNSETIKFEVLRSTICQGGSDLEETLLMTLMPLIESAQDFNSTISGQKENTTLPMILSEWQKLYNHSQQLLQSVERLAMELGGAYWMNWMPENCTHDVTEMLQQSAFLFMVKVGQRFEMSELWHVVKNYFHMVTWVLNYRTDVDTPLNCTADVLSSYIYCKTENGFDWPEFITAVTQTLMSPSPDVLLNNLKGAVNLLQHLYQDSITAVVGSFLEKGLHGGDALTSYVTNLMQNLQGFIMKALMLPDKKITDPEVMSTLVSDLFQSTGLSPLLPLFLHDSPVNASTVQIIVNKWMKQPNFLFLLANMMLPGNSSSGLEECFEPQNQMVTAQCVMGLVNGVSSFIEQLPALQNETAILQMIPKIVNDTISEVLQGDFGRDPFAIATFALNTTLAKVRMALQINHIDTPEVMKEITVVESLIQLAANPELCGINMTQAENPIHAEKIFLENFSSCLKQVEMNISNSSLSDLQPFISVLHKQVNLQLLETEFTLFASNQIENLIHTNDHLINGTDLMQIGLTAVGMFERLFQLIKSHMEFQYFPGMEPYFNISVMNPVELQINQYVYIIQKWMNQQEVQLVLSSMLQWENPNINASTPFTDIRNLLQSAATFFNPEQLAYVSTLSNFTQSLNIALMLAETPPGIKSDYFIVTILEIVQRTMQVLSMATHHPLPVNIEQNILNIVNNSLKLVVQPSMNFDNSRIISIQILKNVESLIGIFPELAEYLLPGIKIVTTYFESSLRASGSDSWNQIILNEMMTVQSLLPPNSEAKAYVSILINITQFVLEPGQGNMSIWAMFESASEDSLPMIVGKMGRFIGMLWPVITGGQGPQMPAQSLEAFAHVTSVLEDIITGMADQFTWDRLENILEGTGLLEIFSSVVPLFEKAGETLVNNMEAQTVMILGLKEPIVTLLTEVAQFVNSSHFSMAEVSERMQDAIEDMFQAAQQANGTLECSDILKVWNPVREVVGLSREILASWCSSDIQPVLETYNEALIVYSNLNMSLLNVVPTTADAAAERIVKTLQSVYQVNLNHTHVAQSLIRTISSHLFMLTGQPLSPEAHWFKQLLDIQLQNSLSSLEILIDEVLMVAPSLKQYTEAVKKAAYHVVDNYHKTEEIAEEAVIIFLDNVNITLDNILSMMNRNHSFISKAALIDMMRQGVTHLMMMFEDVPMVYQSLMHFLESSDANLMMENIAETVVWLASSEGFGMNMLSQALPEVSDFFWSLLYSLSRIFSDMQKDVGLFEDADSIGNMMREIVLGGFVGLRNYYNGMYEQEMTSRNNTRGLRHKRDSPLMPMRGPMDDFVDLLFIDYGTMFESVTVPPTPDDITKTFHVLFANPDLNIVTKGVTTGMPWHLNATQEETIDAALGMLFFFTLPRVFDMPVIQLLQQAVGFLPDGLPFAVSIKQISAVLASESPENLNLLGNTLQTATELLQINLTDPRYMETMDRLTAQVCAVQNTSTVQLAMSFIDIEPGHLCSTLMPTLQILVRVLQMDFTTVTETLFETTIGDPHSYDINSDWTSLLSQGLNFNLSSLSSLNIDISPLAEATFGEMMRDGKAFVRDVQQHMRFDSTALQHLMDSSLPNNNLEMLSWLVNLRHCSSRYSTPMDEVNAELIGTFCDMSVDEWYMFSLLVARHVNTEKLIYKTVLTEELQSLVGVMLQMAELITEMMGKIIPTFGQLQDYLQTIEELDLTTDEEFLQMTRRKRSTISTKATFVTLSRALCSNGVLALFGIAKLPLSDNSSPSSPYDEKREEMIERFKLPRNASPFCMNMYLDMVNTTGGAIAWAFLKPMLMGQILYTPDTPVTRDIMKRSNATLNELANLRKHSEEWLGSSQNILNYAEILSFTLPMLQNSLGNSFVKKFIEMQTDINVDTMRETLSNFSNMTLLLEKNREILTQITTLSTLMINLSSCVKFDRHRGYSSEEELDADAQELAKNRDLYGSVIFKLPQENNSTRKRREASSLPPKVSYTIRMHMDNVMRTDRMRNPYYTKETHISAQMTLRYNRGFVYLQETIDRAIIAAQTGQAVAEPAVQLQPFPYPCHLRDEYLEAISFVFPLMLMMAWVLFVADFVKKLVYERELRLHEYMKMMGVNPISHFFAWLIECAAYLVMTIFILTLVLKYGNILAKSDGLLLFLYLCNYGLSILAFSYLISSLFNKTFIAGLSGSLLYVLCFFPFIVVMAVETTLTFSQKNLLSLFSPTCFSYASQYVSRYESQGEGIQWSNSYTSPLPGDLSSFGWLNWLMLIDSILYFVIGAYIRMVFPGKYGIPCPWNFPFKYSFWAELCSSSENNSKTNRGLLFTNIMQENQPVFSDNKGKGQSKLSSQAGEDYSHLPVGVALHSLSKMYGDQVAIHNLNVSFYEGHVTSLLGHNGAGKTTTMSLLTGLFAPTSGSIEVYGRDMQTHINDIRKELGVCMQYDVLFDFMTAKEHLLLYGQIKAPHWTQRELREQVRTILEETGMYSHRHKRVGTLSGGMKRKLSISIAFIGGSRLVVLDEPTTGVDPCSRRSIWDIVIQHKKQRTIIMSTHHLDEAEVLSDRITFLERGGLKCCGSPFHLKDKLGQGYKLTITKKMQNLKEPIDNAELKSFIQAHIPEARLKEAQGGDLVYSLPPFNSSNASSYRSLLTALDANLDALQLGGYGVSDTTLEEVFLQLAHEDEQPLAKDSPASFSADVSDTGSLDSFPSDSDGNAGFSDNIKLTGSSTVSGMALAWQQLLAMLTKRFHHSRRDWKGLLSQILLPALFMVAAMGLGSIKNDLQHYPELNLSPALYKFGPSYSFFSNSNPNSERLINTLMSYPGIDNECLDSPNAVCSRSRSPWRSSGNSSKAFSGCKCTRQEQICETDNYQPPHKHIPSSQILYNLSGINVENYLLSTANDFIRNRYGGFAFGLPLPPELQMDVKAVPKNRTLSKVWFNPEGHHTMPAYLNSINNFILRSNLPADKDPHQYAISVSSHPYFGRADDEDSIIQGMLQILVAMCVMTGYSITTASFAIYVVHEHHSGSKRLQHISGISEHFYWIVNFFYDMTMYLIPVSLTIAVIAAFQIPAFTDRQNLGAVSLLLVLFGFATFPWMYLLSGMFKDEEMAFISFVCINLFISVNTILPTSILYFLSQISTIDSEVVMSIFTRLCNGFLIFPQFNFGHGMMQLARKNIEVQILSGYGIDAYQDPFSLDALGWMFISSFIAGVVLFSLRLLLNKFIMRKVRNLLCHLKMMPQVSYEEEDKDVAMEHQRVASGAAGSEILQINQLGKVYQSFSRKVHAVKRVSLGIPAGECFGLLGVNGAGKTTTFKMLTGDVSPTEGTAQIRDRNGRLVDIMECRNQGINIGYCPQVDALDNLLTGEEHLYFYARIRGISKREVDQVVRYLLRRLELDYHRNITTEGYSCGTRRKLSTALSLIGHPQILLLDEPSSGMDPRTKRHLWKIISEEVKGKCAVVLTSHSMEECEALCSRLAIMVKGQFRCLGSLQHIKNRFGSGFTVKMYLVQTSCNVEAITCFMQRRFPSTYLKDQHSNMVEFHVPVAPGGVADIFDQLESNKSALGIKHFSVSQTTLDEVFINFAMENTENMDSTSISEAPSDSDSMGSVEAVQS